MVTVFSTSKLRGFGFADRDIRSALNCCLERVRRGQFALLEECAAESHAILHAVHAASNTSYPKTYGDMRDKSEQLKKLIRSYADELPPGAAYSHVSAALLHGLDLPYSPINQCEMFRANIRRITPTLHVRDRKVSHDDISTIGGLPVTSLVRTLTDIARDYELEFSVPLLSEALRAKKINKSDVLDALTPTSRGCRSAALAIELSDERHDSAAESICAVKFFRFGITGMIPQVTTADSDGRFIGINDFRHERYGLIVECHGVGKYFMGRNSPDAASKKNHERHMRLLNAGFRVFNLVWADLFQPREFIKIKAVLDTLSSRNR